jgi:hypothetical protein
VGHSAAREHQCCRPSRSVSGGRVRIERTRTCEPSSGSTTRWLMSPELTLPLSAVACPPSSIHSRPSAVDRPSRDCWWLLLCCGHGSHRQRVTHCRKCNDVPWSRPSGPRTCQHRNRNGVDSFRAGARSGHHTRTRGTHTPDTAGSAKPMLYPKGPAQQLGQRTSAEKICDWSSH